MMVLGLCGFSSVHPWNGGQQTAEAGDVFYHSSPKYKRDLKTALQIVVTVYRAQNLGKKLWVLDHRLLTHTLGWS